MRPRVGRQQTEAALEAPLQLRLERIVAGVDQRSVLRDARVALHGPPRIDRARSGRRQVDIARDVKLAAAGTNVGKLSDEAAWQLALNVEIPFEHVGYREVGGVGIHLR